MYGPSDPVTHDVYIVTGNGPWNGRTDWGDSVLKLNPAGSTLLDAYTPTNQAALADQDLDLGSTGPALLPPIRQGGHVYHLLVQGGKGPTCDSCGGAAWAADSLTAVRRPRRGPASGRWN